MNRFFKKLKPKNWLFALVAVAVVFGVSFGVGVEPSHAQLLSIAQFVGSGLDNFLASVIGGIVKIVTVIEGVFIYLLTSVFVSLVTYNGFVTARAVQVGWTLVRDVANMFFAVVLLVIAIATILRYESYNIKKMLPKLLILAVAVNFSRLITGLIIDGAQVIMLSFVAAFHETMAANIFGVFKVRDILNAASQERADGGTASALFSVAVTGVIAIIFLFVMILYLVAAVAIVAVRIIMLWLLVVLSPLAFLMASFPQGVGYARKWWEEFVKYAITGPVLAFFLWLSLAVLTTEKEGDFGFLVSVGDGAVSPANVPGLADNIDNFIKDTVFTGIGNAETFLSFIIGVGMLMAGLVLTQQIAGVGAKFAAGAFRGRLANFGLGAAKAPFKYLARKNNEKIYEGKKWAGFVSPKLFNPVGAVRAWNQRRDELHERAKIGATAGYQESIERLMTGRYLPGRKDSAGNRRLLPQRGVAQPHRLRLQFAEQGKYASDYKFLAKERIAQMTANLASSAPVGKRSAETQAKLRALVQTAFENGYDDDLLDQKYFRDMAPINPQTNKRRHLSKEHYLKAFHNMVGDHDAGLSLLSTGDDISHRTKHFALAGLAQVDNETGEIRMSDYDVKAKKFNFDKKEGEKDYTKVPEEAIAGQISEATKESGRMRGQWHFQGLVPVADKQFADGRSYRIAEELDQLGLDMITAQLKGQSGKFIEEHYTGRTAMALFGGKIGKAHAEFADKGQRMVVGDKKDDRLENTQIIQNIAGIDKGTPWAANAYFKKLGGEDFIGRENEMRFQFGDVEINLGDIRKARDNGELNKIKEAAPDQAQALWRQFFDRYGKEIQDNATDSSDNENELGEFTGPGVEPLDSN